MTTTPTHPTLPASGEEASLSVQLEVSPRRLDDPDSLDFRTTPLRVVAVTERDIPLRILTMLKRDQLRWDSDPVLYAISRPNPHQPTSYRATPLRMQSLGEGVRAGPAPRLLGLSVVDDENILGVCLVFEGWARSSESDSSRCEVREAVYVPKPSSGDDIEAAIHVRGCSPESVFADDGPVLHRGWLPLLLNRIVGRYPLANEPAPVRSPAVLREFLLLDVPLAYLRSRVCSAHEWERDPLAPLLTTEGVQAELRNFSEEAFNRWAKFLTGEFSVADLEGFPDIPVDIPLSASLWRWLGVHTCVTFLQTAVTSCFGGLTSPLRSAFVPAVISLSACATVDEVLADESLWQDMQDDPALSGGWDVLFGDYAVAFLQMREGLMNYISSVADVEENYIVASWESVGRELLPALLDSEAEAPHALPESVRHLFPALREWVSDRMSEDEQELMEHYLR